MFTPIGFFAGILDGPLLDVYPNAAFAYSVRKLRSDYTGDCMRIYKQTGGTFQNFGFDADGYLDVTAIETYLGSSNGWVDIWYDQSGNGNDLDIGATGTRALIASAGTVTKLNNGKASMKRVAAIGVSTGVTSRGDKTMITCAQNNENGASAATARIISNFNGITSVGTALIMQFYRPNGMRVFDGGGGIYFPGARPNEAAIAGYTKDGGDLLGTYNGNTQSTPTSTGNVDSDNFPIYVFDDRGGSNQENSDGISEVVLWDNAVYNIANVADNLNDFYGLY